MNININYYSKLQLTQTHNQQYNQQLKHHLIFQYEKSDSRQFDNKFHLRLTRFTFRFTKRF